MRTWFSANQRSEQEVEAKLYLGLWTMVDSAAVHDFTRTEIEDWCWARLGGVMFGQWYEGRYTLFFEHDTDAVAFVLTFGGAP